jgi:streptogramin lyase
VLSSQFHFSRAEQDAAMRISFLAVFMVLFCGSAAIAQTSPLGEVADQTIQQLKALEQEKQQRTPAQKKISSSLLDAIAATQGKQRAPELHTLRPAAQAQADGKVLVIVKGDVTPQLQQFIISDGGSEIVALPQDKVLSARLPLSKLEAIAARPEVKSIDFAQPAVTEDGPEDEEGDFAHAADAARTQYSTTGVGQKICVISDSVDYLQEAKDNGSLDDVDVDHGSGTGFGEGTAMLEIVHRIAPGATLAFAPGGPAETNMAQSITELKNDGCTIIVDDITYFDESPFQDGLIAKKVRDASDAGILYFSSAANAGNKMHGASGTWEGDFKASTTAFVLDGKTYTFHEFEPGEVYDTMTDSSVHTVSLFWSDPLGAASNDYQLAIIDTNNNVVRHSNTTIDGTTDPYQYLYAVGQNDRIAILQGPNAEQRFLHLATNRGRLSISTNGTTSGHHASAAAITVGQVDARDYQTDPGFVAGTDVHVRNTSADGPRRIFYDRNGNPITHDLTSVGGLLLRKPELSAAACITTDVPGPVSNPDEFHPFCGTSAAAPHAAAIAALVLESRPSLTSEQVRGALMSSSLDIETPRWDDASGCGIAMPGAAVAAPTFDRFNRPVTAITGVAAGPDGAMWFVEKTANKIGRIPISAQPQTASVTEYAIPTAESGATEIIAGPDGALWFTEINGHKIGRITTGGTITEYKIPGTLSQPGSIAAGPDGDIWFTEPYSNKIGRITTGGVITEYPVPSTNGDRVSWTIAAGPDSAMWFSLFSYLGFNKIGRIPVTAAVGNPGITLYSTPMRYDVPQSITTGPDGAMWFTETYSHAVDTQYVRDKIGRIPVTATAKNPGITEYLIPTVQKESANSHTIVTGEDGALWFTDANKIGRITTTGEIEEYALDQCWLEFSYKVAADSNGALWLGGPSGIARAKPK